MTTTAIGMLGEILDKKRATVAERKRARPLASFRAGLTPSDRSLEVALRRPRTGFILECKRASPSEGPIRDSFSPRAIASAYAPFADGISVLCDEPYFGGALEHLAEVRSTAPQPVLCKDFVVDPYQIYEARHYGADAILLIVAALSQDELRENMAVAKELQLDVLVEVHDADELERANALEAEIIGINNRNLKTLVVDLETTRSLIPRVRPGAVTVCESGIRDHRDIVSYRDEVDAFLVGTTLMREPDLHGAVRRLLFGRVKICGLTRHADAITARAEGATFGGVVLWPDSSRAVDIEAARRVLSGVDLAPVGVFVDPTLHQVLEASRALELAAVQIHGSAVDHGRMMTMRDALPDSCELWRARRVGEPGKPIGSASEWGANRLLLDAYAPRDGVGGTGHRFDWEVVRDHPERHSLLLSGGITPENAGEADELGVWGLDLSSGVERRKGHKDGEAVRALFAALRGQRDDAESKIDMVHSKRPQEMM